MTEHTAQLIVDLASSYAVVGLLFAAVFVTQLAGRIDPSAAHGTWGFRLVIVPGVIVLWPYLLGRLLRGAVAPPDEWTAHRALARSPASIAGDAPARGSHEARPVDRHDEGRER